MSDDNAWLIVFAIMWLIGVICIILADLECR